MYGYKSKFPAPPLFELPVYHFLHLPALSSPPPSLQLPVYLVKGPGVGEARVPHLVDQLLGVRRIAAERVQRHGDLGAPPHALLVLHGDLAVLAGEELAHEAALATQA